MAHQSLTLKYRCDQIWVLQVTSELLMPTPFCALGTLLCLVDVHCCVLCKSFMTSYSLKSSNYCLYSVPTIGSLTYPVVITHSCWLLNLFYISKIVTVLKLETEIKVEFQLTLSKYYFVHFCYTVLHTTYLLDHPGKQLDYYPSCFNRVQCHLMYRLNQPLGHMI